MYVRRKARVVEPMNIALERHLCLRLILFLTCLRAVEGRYMSSKKREEQACVEILSLEAA